MSPMKIGQSLSSYQQVTQWRAKQRALNKAQLDTQNALFSTFFNANVTTASGQVDLTVQLMQTRLQTEQKAKVEALQKQLADLKV